MPNKKYFIVIFLVVAAFTGMVLLATVGPALDKDVAINVYDTQVLSYNYPANMQVMNNIEYFTFINRQNEVGIYDEGGRFSPNKPTEGQTYLVTSGAKPVTFPEGEGQMSAIFAKGYAISIHEFTEADPDYKDLPSLDEHLFEIKNNVAEHQDDNFNNDYKVKFEMLSLNKEATAVISNTCGLGGCDTNAVVFDSSGIMIASIEFVSSDHIHPNEPFKIIKDFTSNIQIK